jgi:hypothetical protein
MQAETSETIARLETDLAIAKAELSVATLITTYNPPPNVNQTVHGETSASRLLAELNVRERRSSRQTDRSA